VEKLIFLYYALCYTAGAAGLIGAIACASARGDLRDARFALFSGSFACIVVSFTALAYFDSAGGTPTLASTILYLVNIVGECGLIWFLPGFMDVLAGGKRPVKGAFWAALAAAAALINLAGLGRVMLLRRISPIDNLWMNVPYALMLVAIAYAVGRGLAGMAEARRHRESGAEGAWQGILGPFTVASLVFFPFIVIVDLFPEVLIKKLWPGFPPFLRSFPLLYAFFNAVYLARLFKEYLGAQASTAWRDGVDEGILARAGLSTREAEVARLLAAGLCYKEIAWRLKIRMGTVQSHVTAAYRKLGVSCKEDLMLLLRGKSGLSGKNGAH
jgi:DNA-binding CsgD family transcriptional regulator